MKKAPLITYLGATLVGVGTLVATNKMLEKYGQPLKAKKRLSLEKIGNIVNKVLDKVGAK